VHPPASAVVPGPFEPRRARVAVGDEIASRRTWEARLSGLS